MQVIKLPFILRLNSDQKFTLQYGDVSVTMQFAIPSGDKEDPTPNALLIITSNRSILEDDSWAQEAYSRVNDIIRAYQIVTGEIFNNGIINQLTWNQFTCRSTLVEIDEEGKYKEAPQMMFLASKIAYEPIDFTKYTEIKQLSESSELMANILSMNS